MIKVLPLLLFIGFSLSLKAQNYDYEAGQYLVDYDTTFIEDYRHKMSISALFEFKNYLLAVFRKGNKTLNYTSNLPKPLYGMSMSYRWLNFGFTVAIPKLSISNTNFSESNGFSLSLSPTGRSFYMRNFYEEYSGYRLRNPEEVNSPLTQDDINTDFPSLKTHTFYTTLYYGFNHDKFSYRSLVFQSEKQKKSAGSFIVGLSGGFKWINSPSDRPFVPDSIGEIPKAVVGLEYFNIGINGGYAHTFVIKKNMNISLLGVPGLHYLDGKYKYHDNTQEKIATRLGLNTEVRVQLGYNTKRFFGSLSYSSYVISNWLQESAPVASLHNYFKLNIGYHFKIKPIKVLKPFGLSN